MTHLPKEKRGLGWRLYWKGFTGALCLQVLFPYTEFVMTKSLELSERVFGGTDGPERKKRCYRHTTSYPILQQTIVAALTGASVTFVTTPIQTLQVNAQRTLKPMWTVVFPELIREPHQPIRHFYHGAGPMAIRNGTFATSLFVGVPYFKQKIQEHYPEANPLVAMAFASITAGTIANIINSPIDVLIILRRAEPSLETLKTGYRPHASWLFLAGFGWKIFLAGFGWRTLASTIELAGFHCLRQWYSETFPRHSPELTE